MPREKGGDGHTEQKWSPSKGAGVGVVRGTSGKAGGMARVAGGSLSENMSALVSKKKKKKTHLLPRPRWGLCHLGIWGPQLRTQATCFSSRRPAPTLRWLGPIPGLVLCFSSPPWSSGTRRQGQGLVGGPDGHVGGSPLLSAEV